MKTQIISSLLMAGALTGSTLATRVATIDEAKTRALQNKRNIIVLVHGGSWNKINGDYKSVFNSWSMESNAGSYNFFVTVEWDQTRNGGDPIFDGNRQVLSIPRSLPCLVIYDYQGRFVKSYSGVNEIRDGGWLAQSANKAQQQITNRDNFWKQAESATGTNKATLLGKGLDAIPDAAGRGEYQSIRDQIAAADPSDTTGYIAKYKFSVYSNNNMVYSLASQGKYAEAETNLSNILKNPVLTVEQRQLVQASRFALYQRWAEKKSMQKSVLETMRDLNPNNAYGVMASRFLSALNL